MGSGGETSVFISLSSCFEQKLARLLAMLERNEARDCISVQQRVQPLGLLAARFFSYVKYRNIRIEKKAQRHCEPEKRRNEL
jgi:hypothetical protein